MRDRAGAEHPILCAVQAPSWPVLGAQAQRLGQVGPIDPQLAIVGVDASDHEVDVGVVSVAVADGRPAQLAAEILFHPADQAPRVLAQIELVAVLGRDDASELVPLAVDGKASNASNVLVYSNGATVSIGTQASITALVDAPAANVTIGSRTRVNGCVGAGRQLTLQPEAVIASANPNATLPMQPTPTVP
jgi:hypothetical protein